MWILVKVNNNNTRGTSMFHNFFISMRSFRWMQLCVNLFEHLSFYNLFHFVHGELHDEANMCTSWRHKEHKITRCKTLSWTCFKEHWLLCARKPNFSSPACYHLDIVIFLLNWFFSNWCGAHLHHYLSHFLNHCPLSLLGDPYKILQHLHQ